ncbi:anthranilate synthase component II [Dehalogenimonas alkenigignens]|uniref:Anthranilate synthase, component II n=1 Tax=Dehalogenimonas alkenigignens TaxID=1217799 RepID=A0A0W0GHQ9_9CHLR|nr:aminodeoxychorismate/anthranilate synthase component II [Dehalogenimonas alkenigignens]KTB48094.1 anthranilate synthase, component II [Dehalogenimonas alkenigignens]PVV84346.1 aminodeoxychorismate/anthranilate synthase component II [Dehalogenimonas alkenigignens]
MILLIDNYDSFTYNLFQYLCELGADVCVRRNDEIDIRGIQLLNPERIVVSPGPSSPEHAGISNEVIRYFGPTLPVLGVCLGHQCLGHVYGGDVIRAKSVMHGKTSAIEHTGKGIFEGVPSPFTAVRYHSLAVAGDTLPDCLEVTAWAADGEIMGLRHREFPVQGVQFHPESFMSQYGKELLRNFLNGGGR